MNAHKFVAQKGIEEAKRVLEGAPICSSAFNIINEIVIYYQMCDNWWWYNSAKKEYEMDYGKSMKIDLSELKQVVESVEIVEQLGELNSVKKKLSGKHIGYTHFNVGANGRWAFLDHYVDFIPDSAYHIGLINKHIADYELVESYKENRKVKYCIDCGSENLHIGGEIKEPKMCLDCFAKMVGFTNVDGNYIETDILEMVDVSPNCGVRNG